MKKTISLTLILVIMMTLISNVYAASSYKLALKSNKREVNKGDEFTVSVNLSNIQDEKGLIALGATLEYDDSSLELVKITPKGDWTKPSYNEVNGKLVTDRDGYTTSNETVFTITFKVKEESKQNLKIVLSDISASNGEEDIKIDDINTTISVKSGTANPDNILDDNIKDDPFISENTDNENQASNLVNNKVAEKDMPDTGSSSLIVVFIAVASLTTVISFVRMRKNEE